MVTPPAIEAQILRHYYVEKWTIGTIAAQLHIHHGVVKRVLAQAGLPRVGPPPRRSKIDAYLPFISQTLETFPKLTASRLYAMVRERGYSGRPDHFRHLIACHRPRRKAEAYLRLRTLPGEQGQVDWGHFGHLRIGRARRPLMAFVMVLSYSRQIFLRFVLDARMENFLRGHVAAFTAWGGVPRVLLYDNLKSAVLERRGDAIRFHPTLLGFAGAYRYEARPPPLIEHVAASVGKTPYVRFDLNDYSVPHSHVRRILTVLADPHEVRIADGAQLLACHRRSYDKGAQVEDPAHVQALIDDKRAAHQHSANDRLAQAAPASQTLLMRAAERGANLGAITVALMRLLERYGAAALQDAILEALLRDVPHHNAVRLALERRREQLGDAPPVVLVLPAHVRDRDAPVRPHALETYDQLKDKSDASGPND